MQLTPYLIEDFTGSLELSHKNSDYPKATMSGCSQTQANQQHKAVKQCLKVANDKT
jgi:hypothetical protein